jgi:hypothetical protein
MEAAFKVYTNSDELAVANCSFVFLSVSLKTKLKFHCGDVTWLILESAPWALLVIVRSLILKMAHLSCTRRTSDGLDELPMRSSVQLFTYGSEEDYEWVVEEA